MNSLPQSRGFRHRLGASVRELRPGRSQPFPYADPGQDPLRGRQLCVKHTNENGGVLGRRIELVVEDDESKAPTAVAIYETLITLE
jgi:ABC-type branched-subunit amino acid transport system substrate-binding protein